MTSDLAIRAVNPGDAAAIAAIYNHYIRETVVTFEESEIIVEEMAGRIASICSAHPWVVGELDGKVVGYSYARKYHERAAYRHTVETAMIYLDRCRHRHGLGTALYRALPDRLPALNVHVAIAAISLPNPASIALHEKLGFKLVGRIPEVGFKFGRWIDGMFMQRQSETP